MEILTRKQAFNAGKHKYNTGKQCRRGHVALRYVKTGACSECVAGYSRQYYIHGKQYKTEVVVELNSEKDVLALRAYASALNFQRELDDIANGKL